MFDRIYPVLIKYKFYAGVAEWIKAAVLKTVCSKGRVGSNPITGAIWRHTQVVKGLVC